MEGLKQNRQLAAIMFTDIVGYTALMGEDEDKAFALLKRNREIQKPLIKKFNGIWLKEIGDGVLASFSTVTDAVYCAAAIQKACQPEENLKLKIGIHQGEIVFEDGDIFGDGVNIASRIESLAAPGAIYISSTVYQNISNNKEIKTIFIEEAELKNINYKIGIYEVTVPDNEHLVHMTNTSVKKPTRIKWLRPLVIVIILILLAMAVSWSIWQDTRVAVISDSLQELEAGALGVAMPFGPRIAVLPFKNLSNDQEQKYFSDGLTEDLITALSRSNLFVLGFSTNLDKVSDMGIIEIGKELDVRYVLKGSVQRDANTIKVSGQLFDTKSGAQIWGESYSRDLTVSDIFAVQDDITTRVVGTIADGGIIARVGMAELKRSAPNELAAYECVLRSYAYEELHTAEAHLLARDCVESAIEIDSTYADALGIAAYLYREEHFHDFNQRPDALLKAMSSARRAIEIDPLNQNAYHALAFIYADFGISKLDEFFIAAKQAIELNPNNTRVIGSMGALIAYAGEWQWGIELLEKTISINPYSPLGGWLHFTKSVDLFYHGNFSEALVEVNQSSIRLPVAQMNIIAINSKLGNKEEAISTMKEALAIDSLFIENAEANLEKFFIVDKDLRDQILGELKKTASWMEE
jgi:adenylate cyclase